MDYFSGHIHIVDSTPTGTADMPTLSFPFMDLLTGADYIYNIMTRDWMFHCIDSVIGSMRKAPSSPKALEVVHTAVCLIFDDIDYSKYLFRHQMQPPRVYSGPPTLDGRPIHEARVVIPDCPSIKVAKRLLMRRANEWNRYYSLDGTYRMLW